MARTIEITADTVVKILVRRGTDSERQVTTFTEGELGYTIDTQRLFIGDGITPGGIIAGNKFLGFTSDYNAFTSIAQYGDTVYQVTDHDCYAYDKVLGWESIHPLPYTGYIANSRASIEKASHNGSWRVSPEMIGDGFVLIYDGTPVTPTSITGTFNRLDFDATFISLCADFSSFYFGNVFDKQVTNNLEATVNVADRLYVNAHDGNTTQIQVLAKDPLDTNASLIKTQNSHLHLNSYDALRLYSEGHLGLQMDHNSALNILTTTLSSQCNGSLALPNFDIRGIAVFRNPVIYDSQANVTILGNLSVFGDTTYLETTVTTTSALSVINRNDNETAMVVAQLNTGGSSNQTVARFEEGTVYTGNPSILQIKEKQFVGVGVGKIINYDTFNSNFMVSGASLFRPTPAVNHDGGDGWPGYIVDMRSSAPVYNGNIEFYTAGNADIIFENVGGGITFNVGGFTNSMFVSGNLRVSEDIVAFSLSDVKYKNNIKKIDSALDKIDKISGVEFEWDSKSPYSGKDIGVLAHEVEKVIPEVVTTRSNGSKAVRYEKIVPLLIEAIKELKRGK